MAQFRVGQRVRILGNRPSYSLVAGREATIIGELSHGRMGRDRMPFSGYPVDIDGFGPLNNFGKQTYARPECLAPLLPPDEAADAFMARIKKLGSEPVNDAPKVEVMK